MQEDQSVVNEKGAISDIVNLSDEQFAALDPSFLDQDDSEGTQEGVLAEGEETQGNANEEDPDTQADDTAAEDPEEPEVTDEGDSDGGDGVAEPGEADPTAEGEDPDATKPGSEDGTEDKPDGEDTPAVDFEAEYNRLLAPFKANGREIKIDSVDDAIALMQMGANYNKKMAALKPNLKLLKLLENNSLLSEEKLSFLIDIEKKNPDAIKKLVKDSGLDPLDMDLENASEYKPQTYSVDDREIELDDVLSDIKDTRTYRDTINVVSNKWDGPSRQVISEQPQLLRVINDHMASGVYDLISTEVEKERMLGRLGGVSDLEAYKVTGDAIQARGGFDHLFQQEGHQTPEPVRKVVAPQAKTPDTELNSKRRAASSTRKAVKTPAPSSDFNPLSLSDAEFEQQLMTKLL